MTDLLVVHWFGAFFDLTITFFLIYKHTRPTASLVAASFHLMNSQLFSIGMFPWVCLVELPIFYSPNWPRTISQKNEFDENEMDGSEIHKKPIGRLLSMNKDEYQTTTANDNNQIYNEAKNIEDDEEYKTGRSGECLKSKNEKELDKEESGCENHEKNVGEIIKTNRSKNKFLAHNEKSKSSLSFGNSYNLDDDDNTNNTSNCRDDSRKLQIDEIKSKMLAKDQKVTKYNKMTSTQMNFHKNIQDDFAIQYNRYSHHGNDNDVKSQNDDDSPTKIRSNKNVVIHKDHHSDDNKSQKTTKNTSSLNDFTNAIKNRIKKFISSNPNLIDEKIQTSTIVGRSVIEAGKNRKNYCNLQVSSLSTMRFSTGMDDDNANSSCCSWSSVAQPLAMPQSLSPPIKQPTRRNKIAMTFMIIYCGLQLFLPYSHFITKVGCLCFFS